ncbi:hypothetical protein Scep_027992 [Stephania cephalantha]|uniref:Arginine decarboxylase n=1 Tax=Stephania cephalantha TaxID=152367 RepID=A0AAP0EBA7_9MAGN
MFKGVKIVLIPAKDPEEVKPTKDSSSLLSLARFEYELQDFEVVYILMGNELDRYVDVPEAAIHIVKEFCDVFPDEMPNGLPPLLDIQHQIDLEPGASLPNRLHYRMSPSEHEELCRQVEELLAMSCLCKGSPDGFLICNGYKDAEYVSLALVARRIELNTVIVLEQEEEIELVVEIGRKIGVRPVIGMRAKLRTKHAGHFGSTSREKGKFGLTTAQVLRVAKKLETEGMLGCLQPSHFHIGSQIPSIALLADGRRRPNLLRIGPSRAGMRVIDVGAVSASIMMVLDRPIQIIRLVTAFRSTPRR